MNLSNIKETLSDLIQFLFFSKKGGLSKFYYVDDPLGFESDIRFHLEKNDIEKNKFDVTAAFFHKESCCDIEMTAFLLNKEEAEEFFNIECNQKMANEIVLNNNLAAFKV